MHDDPPLVGEATPMSDALIIMTQSGYGVVGAISESGKLTGIVTDGDLRRHLDGLLDKIVSDVMTRDPKTIGPEQLAAEAVAAMNENKITCLLVVEADGSGQATGIIRIHDCMRAGVV